MSDEGTGSVRTYDRPPTVKEDVFASVVVFLVALPLCMGVARASGLDAVSGD
jgi:MFS superfamily sulfate permease-like transporter